MRGATAVHRSRTRLPQPVGDLVRRHPEGDDPPGHHPTEHRPDETPPRTCPLRPASPRRRTARHGPVEQMPARPRGLLEPCAATSGTHGSEEGGAGKRRPLSDTIHHIRDVTYAEDASQTRTGSGTQTMAALRNLAIAILKTTGHTSIAAACRHHARDATRTLATLGLSPA